MPISQKRITFRQSPRLVLIKSRRARTNNFIFFRIITILLITTIHFVSNIKITSSIFILLPDIISFPRIFVFIVILELRKRSQLNRVILQIKNNASTFSIQAIINFKEIRTIAKVSKFNIPLILKQGIMRITSYIKSFKHIQNALNNLILNLAIFVRINEVNIIKPIIKIIFLRIGITLHIFSFHNHNIIIKRMPIKISLIIILHN